MYEYEPDSSTGTGIAGITNMMPEVITAMMTSISELPLQLQHVDNPVVLVASSGQESTPPVSRYLSGQYRWYLVGPQEGVKWTCMKYN